MYLHHMYSQHMYLHHMYLHHMYLHLMYLHHMYLHHMYVQALIWDITVKPKPIEDPILAFAAGGEVRQKMI